jgi:hypothetical protein
MTTSFSLRHSPEFLFLNHSQNLICPVYAIARLPGDLSQNSYIHQPFNAALCGHIWDTECSFRLTNIEDRPLEDKIENLFEALLPPANPNALRIEIDPATMIITYFIDGAVVGRHKPSDADELQAKPFHFNINIWKSGVDSPVVGLVDNIRIGHIVQFEHGGSLVLGKPVTASSSEGSNYPAKYAVDGDPATSWSSGFSDPQWIQVDLGAVYPVRRVVLNWEASYAVKYEIQISSDGSTWETVYSTTSGDGGMDDLSVSGSGHYVRMAGTSRAVIDGNSYGYSLYEFEVYGAP